MTRPEAAPGPGTDLETGSSRRLALLTGLASAATLGGILLAVARPEWLTTPMQEAVSSGGVLAPLVYVLLCALAAPLHLSGVLVSLSAVTWPLWQALALSFVGLALGSGLSFLALKRAGGAARRSQAAWPRWLARLANSVDRRRVPVGIVARLALGGGLALEAFFLLTNYKRDVYALVLVIGTALYVTQTVLGVTLLHVLLKSMPGLAGVFALSPLVLITVATLLRRRRAS